MKLIDNVKPHRCDLPRRGPFWNRNPLCEEGNIIQCETCGAKWRWTYFGYSGMWAWEIFMTHADIEKRLKLKEIS